MGPGRPTAVIVLALAFLALPAPRAAGNDGPHEACSWCHGARGATRASFRPDPSVCVECHDGASLGRGPLRASSKAGNEPAHFWPEVETTIDSRSGSARPSRCITCHDPHADETPFLLRAFDSGANGDRRLDPISRLCSSCHRKQADWSAADGSHRRHPVGIPAGRMADPGDLDIPVVDVAGTPTREDDLVSCITCHTVHERREQHLLRWSGRDPVMAACMTCHRIEGGSSGKAWLESRRRMGRDPAPYGAESAALRSTPGSR